MAFSGASLLAHATSTSGAIALQLPPLTIKLDRDNYCLWRSTVLSALETFDLESLILKSDSPAATYVSSDSDDDAATAPKPNPDYTRWKKQDRFVLLWLKTTLSERALSSIIRATTSFEQGRTQDSVVGVVGP
uniref:Retrotransposon Copia-like N-terminal domain-containing protein n=1 Tax=Lactuca sativa TaxID=4236 RepID=A0A9R1UWY1_LACSA|nr:hypothetical protein LSAT_V11C700354490 [Lactuca sativa]